MRISHRALNRIKSLPHRSKHVPIATATLPPSDHPLLMKTLICSVATSMLSSVIPGISYDGSRCGGRGKNQRFYASPQRVGQLPRRDIGAWLADFAIIRAQALHIDHINSPSVPQLIDEPACLMRSDERRDLWLAERGMKFVQLRLAGEQESTGFPAVIDRRGRIRR